MNKKKIISLCLVVVLAVTAVTGATLAYFTDTDSAKNVMTLGNVDIIQNEKKQDGTDFVDDVALMPMVDNRADKTADPVVDGFFDPAMKNVVDKIVTVTNNAPENAINQDAYVRTIIAFETNTEYKAGTNEVLRNGKEIFKAYIGELHTKGFEYLERNTIKINGVEYVLAVMVYENPLKPQETSAPSLKQVFMSPDANNEIATLFGSEYTILALSQGVQTAGFTSAEEALNEAFGDLEKVDDATLIEWLSAVK